MAITIKDRSKLTSSEGNVTRKDEANTSQTGVTVIKNSTSTSAADSIERGTQVRLASSVFKAPPTRKGNVVDDYFGTKVPDPYRWLEDADSAETKAWVSSQNAVTSKFLASIPERSTIAARLASLVNYERWGQPLKVGGRYVYSHNTGLQNQSVIYVTDNLAATGRVLLDPNALSTDGTVAVSGTSFSLDGRSMAYGISTAGSDWVTWRIRDVATGRDLPDQIQWCKFTGISWKKDGSGFFYSRYDAPTEGAALTGALKGQKVYYHALGTSQDADALVYARPDQPNSFFGADVTEDGRWLIISQSETSGGPNRVYLKDLSDPDAKVLPFLDRADASYEIIGNDGDTFYVQTDQGAPRERVVAIRRDAIDPTQWKELIPQPDEHTTLASSSLVGGRIAALWTRDVHSVITFHDFTGKKTGEIELPGIGSASMPYGQRDAKEAFYTFASFAHPPTVFRYDFETNTSSVWRTPEIEIDPKAYEIRQVFYPSKDGTKIPMFLVHKKGLVLDGRNPTILYGYGGFNISMTPTFSTERLTWLEMGGVYAIPNLRGGGEYGRTWYDAGRLEKKQNVFDDFIAAAEWLIAQGITSPAKLAINGGSNGGLLVGAVMTQRPELFGAAVPEVGVHDMLRYHTFTVGRAWKSDYLTSDTAEGFRGLMKYSPLHNVRPGTRYPATLVMTADHDDRVVPAHSHKLTATLQAAQGGSAPIFTRIAVNAGHGAGKPISKIIEERADVYAFLVKMLGMRVPVDS